MPYIILTIYLVSALTLQFLVGDFPVSIFAFPLNIVLFLIWGASVTATWKNRRLSGFVRFMLSPGATFAAVGIFLVSCLVIGLTGFRQIVGTWPFIAFILYFQTVLAYVILRGWRKTEAGGTRQRKVRWRFLFLHAGLLTAVASAFWGAPDSETLKLQAFKDVPVAEAYREDGRTEWLDQPLTMTDFSVSYGTDGIPSDYEAEVSVGEEKVVLRVNHPYAVNFGEDMYLSGYDVTGGQYCILQIVREPWRYGALAGIVMMLAGAFMLFVGGPHRRNDNE